MEKPQSKMYGKVWFTHGNNLIGIVTMNNGYEDKAYIGVASGLSEEGDAQQILKHGGKFPFKQAIELTGGKEEEVLDAKFLKKDEIICNKCKERPILQTADFGGKFNCMHCGKLQTMVPSAGHGKVCNDCVKKGFCKYCGEQI